MSFGDRAKRAAAERIARDELVRLEAVCREFRIAKHTLAQILNKLIRVGGVSLATAVADNRPTGGCETDERLLVVLFKLMSFSALLFLTDERP
jgi:hypothetical protein